MFKNPLFDPFLNIFLHSYCVNFLWYSSTSSWFDRILCYFLSRISVGAHMSINTGRRPLHELWIDSNVGHWVSMFSIFGLFYQTTAANVINICRSIFWPSYEISVAIWHGKSNLKMSILMVSKEFSNRIRHSQIPQFDCVVCRGGQERIKRIRVIERSLVKFNTVRMLLMSVV